jgi:hypothetical protein
MRRIVLATVVLVLAGPVWATVDISCEQVGDTNEIVVSFVNSEPNRVRAFALDITLSSGVFEDVNCVNTDYWVYPGSISFDPATQEFEPGLCLCDAGYPGTHGGLDTNAVGIEMASLYVGEANAPAQAAELVRLRIDGAGSIEMSISENVIRHGVVMENPYEVVTVNTTGCTIEIDPTIGTCWDTVNECAGQPEGDANCDGCKDFLDLGMVKVSIFKVKGDPGYNCCADFNHDNAVNFMDLGVLKINFLQCWWSPATGNQNCPP